MYRYILFFLFNMCILVSQSNAQKENNIWTFGYHNGLDFSSGTPVFFQSKNSSMAGSASVSDGNGNLLFYSNGNDVWDANGAVMPNGSGILGNGPGSKGPGASSQGVAIVKSFVDTNQYYLFVLDANSDLPQYLRYSVVDMNLNGGDGDVVAAQKNIILDSFMSEQMAVTQGANCSYWLITHRSDSAVFLAFKIDASGIHAPVRSQTGGPRPNAWGGEMKASSDAKRVVISANNANYESVIELSDFDNATGIVNNTISFDAPMPDSNDVTRYGYSFSPDNSKLYVTNSLPSWSTWGNILQFDLSKLPNVAAVEASRYEVARAPKAFNGMRIGPDNKIYIALSGTPNIARINDPDKAGAACNFDLTALSIPNYALFPQPIAPFYGFGLGSSVVPVPTDTIINPTIDTALCINAQTNIGVDTGYSNYVWDDGTNGNERSITKGGTYWVAYQDGSCYHYIDTFNIQAIEIEAKITTSGFDLSTTQSYVSYQWLLNDQVIPGATDSVYTVTENGDYKVIVENEEGCIDTSDVYKVNNYTGVNDIDYLTKTITIAPNPAHDVIFINAPLKVNIAVRSIEGKIIKEQKDAREISISDLADGIYLMQISDEDNRLIKTTKFIKAR